MWAAKAVLSGGVRRSATICLFSADDEEMAAAKTGNWFQDNPQRTASNNSAVIVRAHATRAQFDKLFEAQKQFGEPGFYFVEDPEYGANPCVEIGLHPRLKLDAAAIARLRELGHTGELREGDTLTACSSAISPRSRRRRPRRPPAVLRALRARGDHRHAAGGLHQLSTISRRSRG
jgi:ribonucleoside-triphosphate reductase